MKTIIQNNLRYLRNKNSLKQTDLATLLNVAPNSYSQYENGVRKISVDDAEKISDYYGISLDTLVKKDIAAMDVGAICLLTILLMIFFDVVAATVKKKR